MALAYGQGLCAGAGSSPHKFSVMLTGHTRTGFVRLDYGDLVLVSTLRLNCISHLLL